MSRSVLLFVSLSFAASLMAQDPERHASEITLVHVAGGTFPMGSTTGEPNEQPVHQVTVSSFYMATTEVTQALYQSLMESNPSYFLGDDLPVERVSWFDAVAFCNRLSTIEKLTPYYTIAGIEVTTNAGATGYRLPSEAQWEWAARGGAKGQGFIYAGSNDPDAVAWYVDNSYDTTQPVGTKQPNELGLYDLSGNVWEWCQDWFGDYQEKAEVDPEGAQSGSNRVGRGGSWYIDVNSVKPATRVDLYPGYTNYSIGFRVVRP